jgi:4-azaleucine resistance transporter AzlC
MLAGVRQSERAFVVDLRRGLVAMLPLWPGVITFALAFATTAVASGYSVTDTVASSLFVFAGSAQFAMVTTSGSGTLTVLLTVLLLNLRHLLYALSLAPRLRPDDPTPRWLAAYFLTDEGYGLTMRDAERGAVSTAFLLGVGLSLFTCYAAATLLGALLGAAIPDLSRLGLEFVFPLTFVALLVPSLCHRPAVAAATLAAALMLALEPLAGSGAAILSATLAGAALGTLLDPRTDHLS